MIQIVTSAVCFGEQFVWDVFRICDTIYCCIVAAATVQNNNGQGLFYPVFARMVFVKFCQKNDLYESSELISSDSFGIVFHRQEVIQTHTTYQSDQLIL